MTGGTGFGGGGLLFQACEVLGIISKSPGALEPVFQTILENAARLCEANFGVLLLYEEGSFRLVAMHNAPPGWP